MRTLFVKILAWFWLATALVIMVVFLTNRLTAHDEPRPHMPPDQMMAAEQVAIDLLERDGPAAAGDYLEELNKNSHARIFIFDRNGTQVAVVSNGKAEIRKVRVKRDFGTRVEVDTGIRAGDQVILNPPVNLADGSKVQPRIEAAAVGR